MKGTRPISCTLSYDFTRDGNNELCLTHHKCFYKMSDSHMSIFGSKPSSCCHSPLEKADHLEIDTAKFLNADVIRQRQSLIGVIQWIVSLDMNGIVTSAMTMLSFRVESSTGCI